MVHLTTMKIMDAPFGIDRSPLVRLILQTALWNAVSGCDVFPASGLASLDQDPLGVRHERPLSLDLLVQPPEPVPVSLHGEARHGPEHLPQEVHDRADIVEDHPQRLVTQ